MGFFEDMGDLLDPLGITDFDNDGTHDFLESMVAVDVASNIIADSIEEEEDSYLGNEYEDDYEFDEENEDDLDENEEDY